METRNVCTCSAPVKPGATARNAAAVRIQGSVDEAAKKLIEWMNDPTVDMRERVRVAQDLLDVAQVRVSLETLAALHLAKSPRGEGMARLRQALQVHLDAIDAGDVVASDLTHLELHRTLWEGSENQMLMRIWPLVESQIRMAMSLDQATRSDPARDADLHRRLVAVIEQGDEQEIADEVRNHIAHSADEIVRLMEEGEPA